MIARHRTAFTCAILAFALTAPPAFAVNKDMVQLQTQVQDLQNAVAKLQQSNDERMGVLKDLVQQNADSVNKMSVLIEFMQKNLTTQQEAASGKVEQVSNQAQALNDSVDEVKARLNNLDKGLQAVQSQLQSINAALQNLQPPPVPAPGTPGATPAPADNPTGVSQPQVQPQSAPLAHNARPSADIPFPTQQGPYANVPTAPAATTPSPSAPPVADLYNAALRDYMAAKYPLSTTEFQQVVHAYPSDQLAGNSYYYIGEIDYRLGKFSAAIKDYDQVINQYPGNVKTPIAHLHKAQALIAIKERDAGIAELRALIQRFPNTTEAAQARSRLNGMGARPTAAP